MRGRVPARSVVIPGVRPKKFPAGEFGVPCALIIGKRSESTDRKVSLNAALRDFARARMTDRVATLLDETLLWLCSIASPIGEERALCDAVEARLERCPSRRADPALRRLDRRAAGTRRPASDRTSRSPATSTRCAPRTAPRASRGTAASAPGASDMKSGLAVMIALAETLRPRARCGVRSHARLLRARGGPVRRERARPRARAAIPSSARVDLAVCLEPSDNKLHLGCTGSIHAHGHVRGDARRTARGRGRGTNAVYAGRAAPRRDRARSPRREHVIDGLTYRTRHDRHAGAATAGAGATSSPTASS